jgi:hypothetical protein
MPCKTGLVRRGFQHPLLRDAEWLADAYSTKSIAEIADTVGVSNTSAQRALQTHGIQRRSRHARRPPIQHPLLADRDWLAAQYTHSTATELSVRLGVDLETVRRALRLHHIAPHTPSETQRLLRPPKLNDTD